MARGKGKKQTDEKDRVPVETMNNSLWTFAIVIVIFFGFMYSSKRFMPSGSGKYNMEPQTSAGETFIVESWTWDKNKTTMQIVYVLYGKYQEPKEVSSRIGAHTNSGESRVSGQVVYASEDTIVVNYPGVQDKASAYDVRLTVDDAIVYFSKAKKDIEILEDISLKTADDYRRISLTRFIEYYQQYIDQDKAKIEANNASILEYQESIQSLKDHTSNKTEAQLQQIETEIRQYETSISKLNAEITSLEGEITEYEDRINNLRKEIDAI